MNGKKILIGITGSIAAYKIILLTRLLTTAGAEVKIIMTKAAADFVTPLTLSTLSSSPILTELADENSWANHVMLGRWADVFLIAPASCNTIAKMANGLCDNLLLAVYLSATCPVVLAPAMDEDMWLHAATKENLARLQAFGNQIIPVNNGALASGLSGLGRMAEPEEIIQYLETLLFSKKLPLFGKKALVTAGPTYEPIDPVRFIGNQSSGKMGVAIAKELLAQGAAVTLVIGPSPLGIESKGNLLVINVVTAAQMNDAVQSKFEQADLSIMAAAVSDFTPVKVATKKIKKHEGSLTIELNKTIDILKSLGEKKRKEQVLVGFALETNNEEAHAKGKLVSKKADMIVLNSLNDEGAGFGHPTNKVTIFDKSGQDFPFEMKSKEAVAKDIVDTITRLYYD